MRHHALLALTSVSVSTLLAAAPANAGLFFSEYVEGSSNNKALEIYNPTSSAVDLAAGGYKIAEYFNGSTAASSTITLTGTIPAGGVFVVANSSASSSVTSVANLLSGSMTYNGNDAIALTQNGALVDVIGQIGVDPGSAGWGSGTTTTTDHTLRRFTSVTTGDTNGSDAFDPATQWVGYPQDTFDGLGCYGTSSCSSSGSSYTHIYSIQGAAHISPLGGQSVSNVPGIVTVVTSTGFYMQDPDGDGNNATSDGIFVYTKTAPAVTVGQQVIVSGSVTENRPGSNANNLTVTEITSPSVNDATGKSIFTNTTIKPTIIGSGGRIPPTQLIDSDSTANVESASHVFDPTTNGIDFYESLEGMLVQVNNAQVVGATDSYGDIWVVGDKGANATGLNSRGGISLVDRGTSGGGVDYNPERIQLVPNLVGGATAAPYTSVNDVISSVTGVISYEYYNYELQYTAIPSITANGLTQTTSSVTTGSDRLRIATYNVDNLDPNDKDTSAAPNCNDTDVASGKFTALGQHIAKSLAAPDILSIEEIQDNTGCTDDGVVDASLTISTLQSAITAAGGPTYSYAEIDPVNDMDGGQPGGNIRQVLFYNPARVSLVPGTLGVGGSTTATGVTSDSSGQMALTLAPGRIDPTNTAWSTSRKPLAAVFQFNGQRVLVVSNHFDSKGGDDPLYGPVQPPVLSSATQRVQQAQIVHDFTASALTQFPSAQVVVLGDLNDFAFSTPLETLSGQSVGSIILNDLASSLLAPEEIYSYVYEGNSQDIDHIYVSNSLMTNAQVQMVHVNSEFAAAAQASDHDPVIASLQIKAANQPPVANAGADQTVKAKATVTLNGTASYDPDGTIASYQWTQTAGTAVSLSSTTAAAPTFKAPKKATTLSFTLKVTDNSGATASDSVTINVTSGR